MSRSYALVFAATVLLTCSGSSETFNPDASDPVGNPPCAGCAGAACNVNGDCTGGLSCIRLNGSIAFCSNCHPVTGDCGPAGSCSVDANCGDPAARCFDTMCFHSCSSSNDCPSGYDCWQGSHCIPVGLPDFDSECATTSAGMCQPHDGQDVRCIFNGTDFVSNPGDNYCTRACTTNADCQDTWALGCCSPENGSQPRFCFRRNDCGSPCGNLTDVGCCTPEGAIKYCNGVAIQTDDCASQGKGCGWVASANPPGYYCGGSGADPSGAHPIDCP